MAVCPLRCCLRRVGSRPEVPVWLDRQLDARRDGPMYLRQPDIAQIVVGSDSQRGGVRSPTNWVRNVIMANHVHLLIRPLIAPDRLLENRSKARPPGRPTAVKDEPGALLAKRILRSLRRKPDRIRKDSNIYRNQSGEGGVSCIIPRTIHGRVRASRRVSTRHA